MVHLPTRFTDPAAVETWDASFRWRDGDVLRDVTIDDTWWRVAAAIAACEGAQAPLWAQRFAQAFSRWRLLPGEGLLRRAGTESSADDVETPSAVVNVAEFVNLPLGAPPELDRAGLVEAAALAVRLLDDAVASGVLAAPAVPAIEIGLIGVADALCKLRVQYASDAARAYATQIASALAEGCLRGSVELARERGAALQGADCAALADVWRARWMPSELVDRALVDGIRHVRLTALRAHPLLARLANGVCEGLVPPPGGPRGSPRLDAVMQAAHEELCRAMHPWIDTPCGQLDTSPADADSREPALNCSGLSSH